MNQTSHALLVINDLAEDDLDIIKSALRQTHLQNTKLTLLYVKPYLPSCYFNIPSMINIAETLNEQAKQQLSDVGFALGVTPEDQWISTGRIKTEAYKLANTIGAYAILASRSHEHELHHTFHWNHKINPMPLHALEAADA